MAARHDLGRVTDAGRGVDDGRASGHHFIDPGRVHVLPVGDRVGNVRLGNDAYRLAGPGVQDRDGGRARVLHQVGGRGHVVVLSTVVSGGRMMSPAVAGAATLACSDISSTSTCAGIWSPRYSPGQALGQPGSGR